MRSRPFMLVLCLSMSLGACRSVSGSSKEKAADSDATATAFNLPAQKQDIETTRTPSSSPLSDPGDAEDSGTENELETIAASLRLIEKTGICNRDSSCVVRGLNKKACGLSTRFAAFSTESPRFKEVDPLLERYLKLEAVLTAGEGLTQICGAISKPTARCISKKCQTYCQGSPCDLSEE